jgi:hypothetical protein
LPIQAFFWLEWANFFTRSIKVKLTEDDEKEKLILCAGTPSWPPSDQMTLRIAAYAT